MEKFISIIIVLTFQFNHQIKCQNPIIKTGYATITNTNKITIQDSLLYSKYEYDSDGRKLSEWKVVLDSTGMKKDEVYMTFDDKTKPLYYKNSTEETFYKHDSVGTIIELKIISQNKDTTLMSFKPIYSDGKLTHQTLVINGKENLTYSYDYSKGRIDEYIMNEFLSQSSEIGS